MILISTTTKVSNIFPSSYDLSGIRGQEACTVPIECSICGGNAIEHRHVRIATCSGSWHGLDHGEETSFFWCRQRVIPVRLLFAVTVIPQADSEEHGPQRRE
ncbi:hypothetical protein Hypma_005124 [Hypsizygus marmoreus]|uniref:Uncharacterized protein n=1 Tax=Hypsizygus marmoreus TaxID=39966 RepID=A0A369K2U8_HYPMA|nr:hypothetical protein Hypma_005124 [Hypsizygus marmoreus]